MPPRKRLKRWLVYVLARGVIGLWNILPFPFAFWLGKILGRVGFYCVLGPRARAQKQMAEALNLTPRESRRCTKELFEHCGMLAVELAMLPRLHSRLTEYVYFSKEDESEVAAALKKGKGAVVVSAHLGNWELLAQRMVVAGFSSSTLARLNPNPYLGHWIVRQRASFGLNVIDRSETNAARRVLGAFKKNHLVGFLIDQDTRVQSTHVPFFGRLASTPIGAAQFALRRNIPVFAMFVHRENRRHRIVMKTIPVEEFHEKPEPDQIKALTAEMTRHIELAVREHPSQWMWFHERWKTQALPSEPQNGNKSVSP